ncbi:MAG: ATPase [Candidatus Firestonebacteria bacterium RIFOXYC2_FULL_39_67]|nr:MAG: ATPase [Candidatus Firestonebacteria bacterium RIFOXYD2_FULL_39_29]OGF55949.1 MAG: ATPase [Candidatus Firestonebacteria bacterium RIFOXYC2_FULL_39_67]OGF56689.1 MAG: ATPase [Candidatus Firestonebacteria bacterium RifOxyC12_full_39_7]
MKFIDREKEQGALDKYYKSGDSEFIVIYGKRRVGKTELIKHFSKEKPHIYFLAQKLNEHDNLKMLGQLCGEYFKDELLTLNGFESWQQLFRYLKKNIKKKFVLAIDEFPYLAETNKSIASIFQAGWDEYLKDTPVMLILCGSSIAMMEDKVLSEKSPLFGRRTAQIYLKPFNFASFRKFFPGNKFEYCVEMYSITGGNPSYIKRMDAKKSIEENIKDNILETDAFLYSEIDFVMKEELREPRNYFAILKAISLGKSKLSEIQNETGLEKSVLHKYLFILEDLRLVEKEVPVTEKIPLKSRKGLYKLQDQFFKFWFRYVLPGKSHLEEGNKTYVMGRVKNDFVHLVSHNYEDICIQILKENEEEIFEIDKIGRWWEKSLGEMDIVTFNEKEKKILFGEVKWSSKAVGTDIYEDLRKKAEYVEWNKAKRTEYYCLFSKSGFTPDMIKRAKKDKVMLFSGDKRVN